MGKSFYTSANHFTHLQIRICRVISKRMCSLASSNNGKGEMQMNIKTVDEVKEKIMWYGKRWTEINALHHVWFYMQYGFQYGEKNKKSNMIEKMYRNAKMFFRLSRLSIERTSRLELVKLFEGNDKATMRYLRKYLDDNAAELFDKYENVLHLKLINSEYERDMKVLYKTIKSLKDIRNSHLAHNDLNQVNDSNYLSELYGQSGIIIDDVFEIINRTKEYLKDVSDLFGLHGVCIEYPEMMDIMSLEMHFK